MLYKACLACFHPCAISSRSARPRSGTAASSHGRSYRNRHDAASAGEAMSAGAPHAPYSALRPLPLASPCHNAQGSMIDPADDAEPAGVARTAPDQLTGRNI